MSLMSEGPTNYPRYYRECYGNPIQLSVVIAESHIQLNNDIMGVYAERQVSDNRQGQSSASPIIGRYFLIITGQSLYNLLLVSCLGSHPHPWQCRSLDSSPHHTACLVKKPLTI